MSGVLVEPVDVPMLAQRRAVAAAAAAAAGGEESRSGERRGVRALCEEAAVVRRMDASLEVESDMIGTVVAPKGE